MAFHDEAVVTTRSGDGGRGCISFRRERFIPRGGPDGGDGGRGGDVIVRATSRRHTLADNRLRPFVRARNGQGGRGKNQTGKNGADIVIEVPVGTTIYDHDTGEILADLIGEGQDIIALRGGKGGKGNQHFATSTNRAPRYAQPGLPGEERRLRLSLRYLADIGLIGLPNVGKSTLISRLTMARPKVDDYPFTTLAPNLGVMDFDDGKVLTLADIPGLVEGASQGKGLGHRFLKHVERTRILLHMIDITYIPGEDILEDFHTLRGELERYDPALGRKEGLVAINKIDLPSRAGQREVAGIREALASEGLEAFPVSALTGEGLEALREALHKKAFEGEERRD